MQMRRPNVLQHLRRVVRLRKMMERFQRMRGNRAEMSRREFVKRVHKRTEEAHIAIRNIRHHAMDDLKEMEKEKLISEDDHRRGRDQLQEITDRFIAQADEVSKAKEKELMDV